jgi:endoglucanase
MTNSTGTARRVRARTGLAAAIVTVLLAMLGVASATAARALPGPPSAPSVVTGAGLSPSPAPTSRGHAMRVVAAMQPGWNLGNTFDAIGADETAWGNPRVTQEQLRFVRSQGFNSIRIPVTWSGRFGSAPGYTVDAAWLARVQQVVDWALADGFYVMINMHHDSWEWINKLPTDRANVLAQYTALWKQLAATFRNHPPKLVFESVNEPQFAGTSGDEQNRQELNDLNVAFVHTVRAAGGWNANRLLVLPTSNQSQLDGLTATFDQLNDPNLAATIHFYGFWPFSVNIAGYTRYNAAVEQDMVDLFDRARSTFVAKGIPVIIGEYALLSYDYTRPGIIERGEVLKFLEAVGYQARTRNLTTMLWDAGSFMNRPELTWRDPGLFAQIKSSWTTRSGTASADRVYVPRTGSVAAQSLTLNLNGTSLRTLRHGGRSLTPGTDYTVSGSTLTLTAAALTRLLGQRDVGVRATLQARFSKGVPWQIDIVSYDPPVLSDATGTTSSFTVPTQFRGDQLATMEAKYEDGSNAGPANWTSFKEFWSSFRPDYSANTVTLTSDFFNEVDSGRRVTLTFHFWSGTTLTYHVTRSDSAVTGSAT